jgi:hypothetical protein
MARDNPLSLLNVPGGDATRRAIVNVTCRQAKKGTSRGEAITRGAGATLSSLDTKGDERKHAANLRTNYHERAVAEKKRKFILGLDAHAKLHAENEYTADILEVSQGASSDTHAVDILGNQVKLVVDMGWKAPLMKMLPTLDLTLGQTKTNPSGVKEKRMALLKTLLDVAAAAKTLGLVPSRAMSPPMVPIGPATSPCSPTRSWRASAWTNSWKRTPMPPPQPPQQPPQPPRQPPQPPVP